MGLTWIARNTIVLLRTGWSSRWPDAERYLGTAERGDAAVPNLHFPGLHPDAARLLAEQRRIRAVGIDTASIDRGQSNDFQAHRVLAAAQVPVFEKWRTSSGCPRRASTWWRYR